MLVDLRPLNLPLHHLKCGKEIAPDRKVAAIERYFFALTVGVSPRVRKTNEGVTAGECVGFDLALDSVLERLHEPKQANTPGFMVERGVRKGHHVVIFGMKEESGRAWVDALLPYLSWGRCVTVDLGSYA